MYDDYWIVELYDGLAWNPGILAYWNCIPHERGCGKSPSSAGLYPMCKDRDFKTSYGRVTKGRIFLPACVLGAHAGKP